MALRQLYVKEILECGNFLDPLPPSPGEDRIQIEIFQSFRPERFIPSRSIEMMARA